MNEDNNNNFILVDEEKTKEKKWKGIIKILLVVAIICSFAMNGYVLYNVITSSDDTTSSVSNKGTVKKAVYADTRFEKEICGWRTFPTGAWNEAAYLFPE